MTGSAPDDAGERSSGSTSARPRSRPASSASTAGCSALARAGYGLESGTAPGWAEQDPEAWWAAVVVAVRGICAGAEPVEVVAIGVDGHGPTLVAGRRSAARRPGRRSPGWTRAPTAEAGRAGEARPGSGAGRSGRCRPRSGWSATSPTVAARDALVPHDVGVARVPADRRRRRRRLVARQASRRTPDRASAATGLRDGSTSARSARWATSSGA